LLWGNSSGNGNTPYFPQENIRNFLIKPKPMQAKIGEARAAAAFRRKEKKTRRAAGPLFAMYFP
jgi:hypothetical protein